MKPGSRRGGQRDRTTELVKAGQQNSLYPVSYVFRRVRRTTLLQTLSCCQQQIVGDEIAFQREAEEAIVRLAGKAYGSKIGRVFASSGEIFNLEFNSISKPCSVRVRATANFDSDQPARRRSQQFP